MGVVSTEHRGTREPTYSHPEGNLVLPGWAGRPLATSSLAGPSRVTSPGTGGLSPRLLPGREPSCVCERELGRDRVHAWEIRKWGEISRSGNISSESKTSTNAGAERESEQLRGACGQNENPMHVCIGHADTGSRAVRARPRLRPGPEALGPMDGFQ